MPPHRRCIVAAVVLTFSVLLTACSGAPTTVPTADKPSDVASTGGQPAAHSAADVAFARNMIPHHQQAVVLAAMVPAHTANAELRVIATHIGADQQAEIRTLNGLLAEWDEPVDPGGMPPSHGGDMSMMGMVDQATLDRLQSRYDAAFDTLWVTSMIDHHEGAIMMAQHEIAHGVSSDAVHVARLIITAQQQEIAMMTHLISASQ